MLKKAAKTVIEVGETVLDTAKSIGNTIYNTSKEQGEITGLKLQKAGCEARLEEFYAQIGKRYCDYINNTEGHEQFNVEEIIEKMQPELEKIRKINAALLDREMKEKKAEEERLVQKAKEIYDADKAQLDKALKMNIITQEEYDKQMEVVQKKFDHYAQLRKIEIQRDMGIITQEEYEEKVKTILA